jgi:type IV pilus assembly protein PilA
MLKKFIRSFRYGQKGFTLIELLVVIAILGVLAAVVVPNVSKFIGKGNVEAANTELSTVRTAAIAYQADNEGKVPTDTDALAGYLTGTTLKGTYTITDVGGNPEVTGVTYPGCEWDNTNMKWKAK